jgi:hypothetical protein
VKVVSSSSKGNSHFPDVRYVLSKYHNGIYKTYQYLSSLLHIDELHGAAVPFSVMTKYFTPCAGCYCSSRHKHGQLAGVPQIRHCHTQHSTLHTPHTHTHTQHTRKLFSTIKFFCPHSYFLSTLASLSGGLNSSHP